MRGMRVAGIDIGSRFIKFVVLQNGKMVEQTRMDTGYSPKETCQQLIRQAAPDAYTVTGYGRQLFSDEADVKIITEIKAVALGAYHVLPACRTIIDIGGQDTKVITLAANGRVNGFEMNDRCAAGTGRFLEVMAKNLGFTLDELGNLNKLDGDKSITINSQCTVFAESEVISLIARGVPRQEIGMAVQNLIASRVASMAKSQHMVDAVVFTGGCAFNQYLKKVLEKDTGFELVALPESPLLAAYGAALHTLSPDV